MFELTQPRKVAQVPVDEGGKGAWHVHNPTAMEPLFLHLHRPGNESGLGPRPLLVQEGWVPARRAGAHLLCGEA